MKKKVYLKKAPEVENGCCDGCYFCENEKSCPGYKCMIEGFIYIEVPKKKVYLKRVPRIKSDYCMWCYFFMNVRKCPSSSCLSEGFIYVEVDRD